MNKGKHTPGPWMIQEADGDLFIEDTIWFDGDGTDANPRRHIAVVRCGLRESSANARLIAAAPELLERLQIMCREWREAMGGPDENRTPGDILEKAEAVIARAIGEESCLSR